MTTRTAQPRCSVCGGHPRVVQGAEPWLLYFVAHAMPPDGSVPWTVCPGSGQRV